MRLIYGALGDSTSTDVLIHYDQIIHDGEFREKDLGPSENKIIYDQDFPPKYDLSMIPVPVYMLVGNNDWLSAKEDARNIYNNLKKQSRGGFKILDYAKFTHNDFVEARDIVFMLYGPLQLAIEKFQMSFRELLTEKQLEEEAARIMNGEDDEPESFDDSDGSDFEEDNLEVESSSSDSELDEDNN
ncbi:hypothetical protein JTB14_023206 [Gonioctena quinquepunctata]|nr:hypothetical protein JTB14_023206 [Gonioctena quinquepunctata]